MFFYNLYPKKLYIYNFQKNLNIWDVAAGIIIVNEAGGKINDIDFSSHEVSRVFAGSNSIYEKMLENLNNF